MQGHKRLRRYKWYGFKELAPGHRLATYDTSLVDETFKFVMPLYECVQLIQSNRRVMRRCDRVTVVEVERAMQAVPRCACAPTSRSAYQSRGCARHRMGQRAQPRHDPL